jgi:ABC-type sugar transport system ATPase subunit
MTMSNTPFVRIEGLSKAYPGVQALKDVSFGIQRGQLHALVGENGAGKSTLIKILAGAEPLDSGRVFFDGQPYQPRNPHEALAIGVSTIYQVFNLLPDRTIMHNILLGKEFCSNGVWLDLASMRQKTKEILATLDASHLNPDMCVGELRVGEQQIVEIAKALINRVNFLIMDEPTAALNQSEVAALFRNIRMLHERGVTILYVSHHLEEVFELADKVTVLRDGRHISTSDISKVDEHSLIFDMIGRHVTSLTPGNQPVQEEEIVLKVEHLSAGKYVQDISFDLHRGEILAVAGLSGSGKTELGKALFGALPAGSGSVSLKNHKLSPSPEKAIRSGMIYLPEDRKNDGVLQQLSIRRNIALSILPKISGLFGVINLKREAEIARRHAEILAIKTPSLDKEVTTLSGGNQQKVALARCLAVDPDVFILMEPTQGIDIGVKFEIYQFIAEQARRGKSILLISSELTEILGLANRVLVMREGRIAADLEVAKTSREEILSYALGVTSSPGEGAAAI